MMILMLMLTLMVVMLVIVSKRALSALNDDADDGGHQPDEKCSFNIVRKDCVVIVLFQIYHDLIREGVSVTS